MGRVDPERYRHKGLWHDHWEIIVYVSIYSMVVLGSLLLILLWGISPLAILGLIIGGVFLLPPSIYFIGKFLFKLHIKVFSDLIKRYDDHVERMPGPGRMKRFAAHAKLSRFMSVLIPIVVISMIFILINGFFIMAMVIGPDAFVVVILLMVLSPLWILVVFMVSIMKVFYENPQLSEGTIIHGSQKKVHERKRKKGHEFLLCANCNRWIRIDDLKIKRAVVCTRCRTSLILPFTKSHFTLPEEHRYFCCRSCGNFLYISQDSIVKKCRCGRSLDHIRI